MFWSGNKLASKLDELAWYGADSPAKSEGRKATIDCAAIELTVGPEIYVTPKTEEAGNGEHTPKKLLYKDSRFVIPRGQFGFILTNEYVYVPTNAIAFISFKAKYKFQGLINVSGFHVDPGWKGRLIFSVYNAGPKDVSLQKHDNFALIWYSDLDRESSDEYHKGSLISQEGITSSLVNGISGEVFSPFKLKSDFENLKKDSEKRIADVETDHLRFKSKIEADQVKFKFTLYTSIVIFVLSILFMIFRQPLIEAVVSDSGQSQLQLENADYRPIGSDVEEK